MTIKWNKPISSQHERRSRKIGVLKVYFAHESFNIHPVHQNSVRENSTFTFGAFFFRRKPATNTQSLLAVTQSLSVVWPT